MRVNSKEELESFVTNNWEAINTYLDKVSSGLELPIYSSVDIRESKNKFAPVDNNIYPAGFNNICTFDLIMTVEKFKKYFNDHFPKAKNIGIIPESNTKNRFYLDHLATLRDSISKAGYNVHIISFDKDLFSEESSSLKLQSNSEGEVIFEKATLNNENEITNSKELKMDIAILNHDQSSKIDLDWNIVTTPVTPSPFIGWYKRQKIRHFYFYDKVVQDFAKEFDINPYLLQASFRSVHNIDFAKKEGLEELAKNVDDLLKDLPKGTKIFIKASQGTYGMGIHVVSNGEEVLSLNRKKRNKLDIGKNNIKFSSILVQEGVETVLKYDDVPAEITIYLINGSSVGGFLRTNPLKGVDDNLNSKGMVFQKFCISEIKENADHKAKEAVYSVISRLSTLASGYELKEIKENN